MKDIIGFLRVLVLLAAIAAVLYLGPLLIGAGLAVGWSTVIHKGDTYNFAILPDAKTDQIVGAFTSMGPNCSRPIKTEGK